MFWINDRKKIQDLEKRLEVVERLLEQALRRLDEIHVIRTMPDEGMCVDSQRNPCPGWMDHHFKWRCPRLKERCKYTSPAKEDA